MPEVKAALLIGAAAYKDPKFRRLRAPAQDLDALAGVLGDPAIGGFDVHTVMDQPSWMVSEQIEDFFADRNLHDLLLLYFSCHGVKDPNGRLYFAATNTRFDRPSSTGISSLWVNEQVDRSRSRRVVLLLDCCYSGAYAKGWAKGADTSIQVAEVFQGRGRAVITASDAMEYAYEGDELADDAGEPSLFTGAVVRGLESGEPDLDRDGWITINELYNYVFDEVRAAIPHQTPTLSAEGLRGDLVLAKNPHEAADRAAREAAEQTAREAAEQALREAIERAVHEAAERTRREAAERTKRERAERAERVAQERAERLARVEAERAEAERVERERLAREEVARVEAERVAREEAQRARLEQA